MPLRADTGHSNRQRPLGAGLTLIAKTADSLAIRERTPRGIEVWMRFQLASAATAPPITAR
jgi:hypothetical protein